ncbi:LCP family protein [Embleya sp. NBC_00896]|uniref:LCP family protein n=1 Tax=Embleya sp. NBC_00896 TaxID=2975961 RepID=UPI00386F4596|nr:LCP family protein [Embleya sp. NBC_00896]
MSNDDQREWEPYGTERGDGGQAREQQPGHGSYGPDGAYTGYDPQPPGQPGTGPGGLDPVSFSPQQYQYDANTYDPNAYDPGTYAAPTGYDTGGYDTGAGAGTYDPNAYGTGGGYDPNAYSPNAYDSNTYDPNTYGGAAHPAEANPQPQQQGYQDPAYGRSGVPDQQGYYQQQPAAYYEQPPEQPVVPASRPAPTAPIAAPIPTPSVNPAGTATPASASTPVRPASPRPTPSAPPTPAPSPADDGRVPQPRTRRPGTGRPGRPGYGSDEFAFVDDESEQAEDVIDWLSFAETRSERRDEKRRAIRQKLVALAVVVAIALVGTGGYFAWDLWLREDKAAAAAPKRGAVLVQLRDKEGRASANAILTVDPAANSASMVSVSSVTIVNADNSSYPLGQLMADEGPGASRDALSDLLGVRLDGSWVVTEPVLQGLVDLTGGIQLNADVAIKAPDGKPLVTQGRNPANGLAALAFANFRSAGEPPAISGDRFGRVLQGLLSALPTEPDAILTLLANMANLPDPSLPDDKLSTLLANLAKATQAKKMEVRALPVSPEGSLDTQAALPIVSGLLGGTIRQGRIQTGPARVMVDDASGKTGAQEDAHTRLLNAGNTYVPGGVQGKRTQPTSTVQYVDDARKEAATQVALTLHLPATAVKKAEGEMLADVVVTLGQDYPYDPPKP